MNSAVVADHPRGGFNVTALQFPLESYRDKTYLTHNFHPYPAKFVPQIPREVIESLSSPGDSVLDPFCGSGTVLVEASLLGRRAIGFDSNPLACLVARVKTYPLNRDQLQHATEVTGELLSKTVGIESYLPDRSDHGTYPVPDFPHLDHWFRKQVISELAIAKSHIASVKDVSVRDFLRVGFSSIIVSVSNQESDTRYAAVTKKPLKKGAVLRLLDQRARDMVHRMEDYRTRCPVPLAEVIELDSTTTFPIPTSSVDLVVTSPPYPNTYDYYLYHKLRMVWLDQDFRRAQSLELGSRNKHNDQGLSMHHFSSGFLRSLSEIHRVLRSGRHCCIVIGDAIIRGEVFRMDQVITALAHESGFALAKQVDYPQRRFTRTFTPGLKSTQKLGHILVFERAAG